MNDVTITLTAAEARTLISLIGRGIERFDLGEDEDAAMCDVQDRLVDAVEV